MERNNYIDFLRFLGITLIVIAHIYAPFTITQIRCFDVPLMVFVSGLSYSGRILKPSWSKFYWPRIKRIIIPVYIFLTFYFILFYLFKLPLTWKMVVNSYLLATKGTIGFVWIMRVFLLIMMVTPFLCKVTIKLKGWLLLLLIASLLIADTLLVSLLHGSDDSAVIAVITDFVPYILGYSIFFILGLWIRATDEKNEKHLLLIAFVLLVASIIVYIINSGLPLNVSVFKYPPTSFYLIYGLFSCILLWYLRRYFAFIADITFVLFVGRNTIWIYLWHILFVVFSNSLIENWILRYIVTYFGAITVFFIQNKAIVWLQNKVEWVWLRYFIG